MIHPYSVADQKKMIYLDILTWKDLQDWLFYEKSKLQNRAYSMIHFCKEKKTLITTMKKCYTYPVTILKLLAFFLGPNSLPLLTCFLPPPYLSPESTCSDVIFPFNNLLKCHLIHSASICPACSQLGLVLNLGETWGWVVSDPTVRELKSRRERDP